MKGGLLGRLRARLGGGGPVRTAGVHATTVLHPSASLQFNGRPAGDITVGAGCHIRGELMLFGHGGRITLGSACYVGEQTRIWSSCAITIGDRVLISHLCTIMDNLTHPLAPSARAEQFRAIVTAGHPAALDLGEKPVTIEDDALISCHCVVLRGVTIGQGAVVGAGSVVTKDVAPFTVVAGNPARLVRELSPDERR
jgi:acetyltransferase-like isoleucine patch superfamily enzyme